MIKKLILIFIVFAVAITAVSCINRSGFENEKIGEEHSESSHSDYVSIKPAPKTKRLITDLPLPLEESLVGLDEDCSYGSEPPDLEEDSDIEDPPEEIVTDPEEKEEIILQEEQETSVEQDAEQGEGESSEEIQQPEEPVTDTSAGGGPEKTMLDMLNHIRVSNGLGAFNLNQSLVSVARFRAQDMIQRDYFSHVTPEGKSIYDALSDHGVAYMRAGENIQYCSPPGWKPIGDFINTWMASPGHRENILNQAFTQIGIGVVDGNNKRMAVIVFID